MGEIVEGEEIYLGEDIPGEPRSVLEDLYPAHNFSLSPSSSSSSFFFSFLLFRLFFSFLCFFFFVLNW